MTRSCRAGSGVGSDGHVDLEGDVGPTREVDRGNTLYPLDAEGNAYA